MLTSNPIPEPHNLPQPEQEVPTHTSHEHQQNPVQSQPGIFTQNEVQQVTLN